MQTKVLNYTIGRLLKHKVGFLQFTWKVKDPNNTPFVRLGGTYNDKALILSPSFYMCAMDMIFQRRR
jgi:hypothetical protein